MSDNLINLPIQHIYPNPNQPREDFDKEKLEELSMSIREYGVRSPILVTPRGNRYMIIAGERRYRASLLAGKKEIPAIVTEADDALVEELALLENIQRQDLNIIEEAKAYKSLLDRGWTKEALAKRMGFKQAWRIDERTNLLNLAAEYQSMVIQGAVGNSQAFEMSRVSPDKQGLIFKKINSGELSTYNKLRAFVDGLIEIERQEGIFAFQTITTAEKKSIDDLSVLLKTIERLISITDTNSTDHLKKAAFHSDISPERIDLIIRHLMKVRKAILSGSGIKEAIEQAA